MILRSTAALLATAMAVTGCSTAREPAVYADRPKVGQCWEATQAEAAEWTDWLGAAPVECSQEHTLETVAVLPVEGDFPNTIGEEFPEAFVEAASATCEQAWVESTQWVKRPNRISNFFFYPPPVKYDSGERWVRCDVGVFATGTSWAAEEHELEVLTSSLADLRDEQRRNPRLLTLCLDSDSTQTGAFGELLKVADCDQPHLWTMVRESTLAESKDEAYPGEEEVGLRAERACTKDKPEEIAAYFWLPPSEGQWKRGDSAAFCFWAEVAVTSA